MWVGVRFCLHLCVFVCLCLCVCAHVTHLNGGFMKSCDEGSSGNDTALVGGVDCSSPACGSVWKRSAHATVASRFACC